MSEFRIENISIAGAPTVEWHFTGDVARAELAGAKAYAERRGDGDVDLRVTDVAGSVLANVIVSKVTDDEVITVSLMNVGTALLWSHARYVEAKTAAPASASETVYAHVERTVHALLDAIADSLPTAIAPHGVGVTPDGIKILAEAVQALSLWPQFNPMNAAADYRKIAEYEVERAVKAKQQLPGCTCPVVAADPANHYKDCDGRKESPR